MYRAKKHFKGLLPRHLYCAGSILILLLTSMSCDRRTADSGDAKAQGQPVMWRFSLPEQIDTQAAFLFYLHGRIIEEEGIRPTSAQYGIYEYEQILDTLKNHGFTVVSEARPKGTDVDKYAAKVVEQIKTLLKAGVPPRHITVAGASKGSIIAMMVSTYLQNRDVNFVLMASCNDSVLESRKIDLHGNILSIYEASDEFGSTCRKFFEKSTGINKREEVELKTGLGHGFLYRPMKEWINPLVEWAKQAG